MHKYIPHTLIAAGAALIALVLVFHFPLPSTPQAKLAVASLGDSQTIAVASTIAPAQGGLVGGETVTITGTGLEVVTAVEFNGSTAQMLAQSSTEISVTAPHTISYTAGDVPVTLATPSGEADGALVYRYATLSAVDRQLEYAFAHWNNYNVAAYGDFNAWGGDCINFVSQTLVARGWVPTEDWFNNAQEEWGSAFVHVPSFDEWLSSHPEYGAVRLGIADRDQAKIGDVVMFDWEGDGSLDHAQVVSDVAVVNGETRISMVGHNIDTNYRDLDYAVSQQGGPHSQVYIWSIPAG